MPEKIWRVPKAPASSSKRSGLSAPSTASQAMTLPTRRSSFAKSSMPMTSGVAGEDAASALLDVGADAVAGAGFVAAGEGLAEGGTLVSGGAARLSLLA